MTGWEPIAVMSGKVIMSMFKLSYPAIVLKTKEQNLYN